MDYIPISKDKILMTLMDNWKDLDAEEGLLCISALEDKDSKKNIEVKLRKNTKKQITNCENILNHLRQQYPKNFVAEKLANNMISKIKYLKEISY